MLTSLSVSGATSVNLTECVRDASFSCQPSSSLLANSLISFAWAALLISTRPANKSQSRLKIRQKPIMKRSSKIFLELNEDPETCFKIFVLLSRILFRSSAVSGVGFDYVSSGDSVRSE